MLNLKKLQTKVAIFNGYRKQKINTEKQILLIKEEIKEYQNATTLEEKYDALVDIFYVTLPLCNNKKIEEITPKESVISYLLLNKDFLGLIAHLSFIIDKDYNEEIFTKCFNAIHENNMTKIITKKKYLKDVDVYDKKNWRFENGFLLDSNNKIRKPLSFKPVNLTDIIQQ